MKKIGLMAVLAMLFVGCEKIDGTLNVVESFTLKSSKNNTITVNPGSYNTELKINSSKKITLNLLDSKFEFTLPKGTLPENGEFSVKSAVTGQPVDIKGVVATQVTNSPVRQTTRGCYYQMPIQVCNPTPNGGVVCHIQYQQRYGNQWINYYDQTVDRDVTLKISKSKMTDIAADFFGEARFVQRIIVNESMCR